MRIKKKPALAASDENLLRQMREDLYEGLASSVEAWSVGWFDSEAIARDALAIVAPRLKNLAADVVLGLARKATGPNGADYE